MCIFSFLSVLTCQFLEFLREQKGDFWELLYYFEELCTIRDTSRYVNFLLLFTEVP